MNINPFANVSLQDYLEIVQIVDSTFPIGSFNHSFGMENYLREDTVTDDKGYEEWQEAYLASQFKYGEGLVIKLVYDAEVKKGVREFVPVDADIHRIMSEYELLRVKD